MANWWQEVQDAPEPVSEPKPKKVDWFSEVTEHQQRQGPQYPAPHQAGPGQGPTLPGEAQAIYQVQPNPEPASFVDALKIAMIEDLRSKQEAFARARFPDDPNAAARYGVDDEGKVIYRANPTAQYPAGPLYREIEGAGARIGAILGEMGPPAGGATGGAIIGGLPGAVLGGMGGLGWRKVAGEVQGDEQTSVGNSIDLAVEGGLNAAAAGAGSVIGKAMARRAVRDYAELNVADTARLRRIAERHGIRLTPAELTDLGSLIQQQTRLGMGFDKASDTMRRFYGDRGEAIAVAVNEFIGGSPGGMAAGAAGKKAAEGVIKSARQARTASVSPQYKALMTPDNMVPEERLAAAVDADRYLGDLIKTAKTDPLWRTHEGVNIKDMPDNALPVLDRAKKLLDGRIALAQKSGDGPTASMLQGRKRELLAMTDEAFPDYAAVRKAYAGESPAVDALEKGIIGQVAKLKNTKLETAGRILLDPKLDPLRVAGARKEFLKAGKEKEWDDLVNTYILDRFDLAMKSKTTKDMAGANLRNDLFGTGNKMKIMREAMGPDRFRGLSDLFEVLEATGRVQRQQSITQPAAEAAQRELVEAAPVTTGIRSITKIGDPFGPLFDWYRDTSLTEWRGMLAKVITSRESMRELKKLRVLSPGSARSFEIATTVLGRAGVVPVAGALLGSVPQESLPPPAPRQRTAP